MWLIPSLINALAQGLQNVYFKKMALSFNPYITVWSVLVVSSVLFAPLMLLGVPEFGPGFWPAVGLRLVIDSVAFTLYVKGIQQSPLSLTVPMISLTPLFSIVSVSVINHLVPSPLGVAGIVVTCAGVYMLNFDHDTKHIFSPFKAVLKERGVLYVAIASILWSVVIGLQKMGIDNSSLNFYPGFFQIIWAVAFTPIAFLSDRRGFRALFRPTNIRKLLPAGIFDAISVYAQFTAFTLALPAYVSAVGNTNILFSAFLGWYLFKEKLQNHIFPIIAIVVGVILITIAQG